MRNRILLAPAVLAVLLLAGCVKQPDAQQGKYLRLVMGDNPGAKADIHSPLGTTAWSEGDEVALYIDGTGYQTLPVETENGGMVLIESALGEVTRTNYAVYPVSAAVAEHATVGDMRIIYPATYDYSGKTVQQIWTWCPLPMVAVNDATADDLVFYNTGSALRLSVTNVPPTAAKIRVRFPGKHVTGTFQVNDPGTRGATLEEVGGETYGETVTFTLPTLESEASVTLNIPLPAGSYPMVETQILDAGDNVVSFNSSVFAEADDFARARGRMMSAELVETWIILADGDTPETVTFRGLTMAPGVLKYDGNTDTDSHGYTITDGTDPLELLPNRTYSHTYGNIYKRWSGSSANYGDLTSCNSFKNNGIAWRIPTTSDWEQIINGSPVTATVNTVSRNYIYVTVDLTDATPENGAAADYSDKGQSGVSYRQLGLLLIPDNATVYCLRVINTEAGTGNVINWSDLKILTDGGCRYLPCLGSSGESSNFGSTGCYLSANYLESYEFTGYYIRMLHFTPNSINTAYSIQSNAGIYSTSMPARVVRD
jgi:hypothetical protein